MRVLLLTYSEYCPFDGAQLVEQAKAWKNDAGLEITLLTSSGDFSELWRDHDLPFIELETHVPPRFASIRSLPSAAAGFANTVSFVGSVAKTFDVLHTLNIEAQGVGAVASRVARSRWVAHIETTPTRVTRLASACTTTNAQLVHGSAGRTFLVDVKTPSNLPDVYSKVAR